MATVTAPRWPSIVQCRPGRRVAPRTTLLSVHDSSGRVRFLSSGWREVLGGGVAEQVLAHGLTEVVHPDERALVESAQRLVTAGEQQVVVEVRLARGVGDYLPVELTLRPSTAPDGAVVIARLLR